MNRASDTLVSQVTGHRSLFTIHRSLFTGHFLYYFSSAVYPSAFAIGDANLPPLVLFVGDGEQGAFVDNELVDAFGVWRSFDNDHWLDDYGFIIISHNF